MSLLKSEREFRYREQISSTGKKAYVTYKSPIGTRTGKFSHRKNIRKPIFEEDSKDLQGLICQMKNEIKEDLNLEAQPFMLASTKRIKLVFNKNGKRICINWDPTLYHNRWLDEKVTDTMIEIESVGKATNRLSLKSFQEMMKEEFPKQFDLYNGSKVARGSRLTYYKKALKRKKEERKPIEYGKKYKIKVAEGR